MRLRNRFSLILKMAASIGVLLLVAGAWGSLHRSSSVTHSITAGPLPAPASVGLKNGAPQAPPPSVVPARDIVMTASLTIDATDPAGVADKVTAIIAKAGGRVDQRSDRAGFSSTLKVRVPAPALDATLNSLEALGTVQALEVKTDDVTGQRVDLDARITALTTSVNRLLAIMRDAKDPDALIKAETELATRQADLQSLQAQRETLRDQITYSSIDVDLDADHPSGPAPQRYHGFLGQIAHGWDTLRAFASELFLVAGFLVPWLTVALLLGAGGYLVRRRIQAWRSRPMSASAAPPSTDDSP